MKNYIIAFVVIVAIFIGIAIANRNKQPSSISTGGDYCLADGKLTDKQPIQSHGSYCLKSNYTQTGYNVNTPSNYTFSIIDDMGNTLKNFDIVHEKQMHLIVVRKDLNNFQHLHPEFDSASGQFKMTSLAFPSDGEYRLFADFTPSSSQISADGDKLPVTIYEDIKAGDLTKYKPQPIGQIDEIKNFNGYDVQMSIDPQPATSGMMTMVSFDIKQNGKPVTNLQNYLGALGHSVVLKENSLEFIHAHPLTTVNQNGKVDFHVTLPSTGNYKLFTQFQHNGKVFTTDFVLPVSGDSSNMDMEGMDH